MDDFAGGFCIPGFAEMMAAETKGGNLRLGAAELS
jgi:hypothetical protein